MSHRGSWYSHCEEMGNSPLTNANELTGPERKKVQLAPIAFLALLSKCWKFSKACLFTSWLWTSVLLLDKIVLVLHPPFFHFILLRSISCKAIAGPDPRNYRSVHANREKSGILSREFSTSSPTALVIFLLSCTLDWRLGRHFKFKSLQVSKIVKFMAYGCSAKW
jgi:hypothetical protein